MELNSVNEKMKVLVLHHTLGSCGGGERVCLYTIKALLEAGHYVVLGTTEKTDWNKVFKVTGIKLPKLPEEHSLIRRLKIFGIYQRPLTALHILRFRKKYDVVVNTHGDVTPLPVDITYLHFPVFALLTEEPWKYYAKYMKSVFWRAYFEPYRLLQFKLAKWSFSKSMLITNSSFSRDVIKKYIGKEALVVYPPVEVDEYLKLGENKEREDAVITISRFSQEKNLYLIPYIAKELPKVKFYVIGSIGGAPSKAYYEKIVKLRKKLGVLNVKLYPNASHEFKLKLLAKSKVLLHLMPFEHFGIAIIEGMASGCIPVVHMSGGQWTDIVDYGKYGIGYGKLSISDIALKVKYALDMWCSETVRKLMEKASIFSHHKFQKQITRIIEKFV